MDSLFILFFLLLAAASHRHALPCPAWLGWMVELDNPFTSVNRAEDALRELHASLRSGGVLAMTEAIFDPHFTSQQSVLRLCTRTGFTPMQTLGHRYAYTALFRKS